MESNGAEGLSAIAEVRAALADRLISPWWYHPAFGVLMAGHVLVLGLGSGMVKAGGVVLFLVGCAALAGAYRRVTGVWVSGGEAGPAGRWIGALGWLTLLCTVGALGLESLTGSRWPVWCLAAVGCAATVALCRRFDSALRAQLRAGA